MIKRKLNKYMQPSDNLKENATLSFFHRFMDEPRLWRLNRVNVANAFSVGMFAAFLPIPFQMVVAAALAIVFRVNLAISVALVWITNPITIPPVFYFCYKVGAYLLAIPPQTFQIELSFEWMGTQIGHIWRPLIFGSLICGIFFAILSNVFVRYVWRYVIARQWKKRQSLRKSKEKLA